jgi:hypothetical protein
VTAMMTKKIQCQNNHYQKKRTASSNRQQSNKKYKLTIKPLNLKDDDNDNDATNKQKTGTVTTVKTNQLITYKNNGQGKNITMQKHVYDYLTSNNGRL